MAQYYPPTGFHFRVSFEGIQTISEDFRFQSVSGLSSELLTESYKEGGQNQFDHVVPLKTQYPDLVLKRGLWTPTSPGGGAGQSIDLQQWCQSTFQSLIVKPSDILISLLNTTGKPLMSWNVKHAWPKKWEDSEFNAAENQIVIETIELTYHYFTII